MALSTAVCAVERPGAGKGSASPVTGFTAQTAHDGSGEIFLRNGKSDFGTFLLLSVAFRSTCGTSSLVQKRMTGVTVRLLETNRTSLALKIDAGLFQTKYTTPLMFPHETIPSSASVPHFARHNNFRDLGMPS